MGDPSPVGQAVRRSSADLRSSGHPLQETTEGEKREATAKQRSPTSRPTASFTGRGRNTSNIKRAGEQGCAARVRKARVKRSAASSGRSDPGTRGKFLSPAARDRHVYSNLSFSLGNQTESLISGGTATVVKSMHPADMAYPAYQKYVTDLYSHFGTLVVGRLSESSDHRPERNTRVAFSQDVPSVALNKVHCTQTPMSSGAYPTRSPSPANETKHCSHSGTEQRQTKQNGAVGCAVRSASYVRGRRSSRRNSVKLCSVKTFLDLSTYSVGRVQIGKKAPEPGPLLLLFLFYSRLHEHLVNDSWRSSKRISSFFSSPYSLTEGKITIRDAKKMAFDLLLHKPPFALSIRHVEEVWASVAPRQAHLNHDPFLAALNLAEFIAFFAGLGVLAVTRASIPGVASYFGKLRHFMRRFSSAREVKNLLLNAYRDTHIPALAKYPLNTKTELPTRDLLLALPQGDVRAIPSVTPDPAAYGWLLEKFVFARAKPVWHSFQGAFLDMGIQRHIPSSEQHDVTQRPYHPALVDAVAASKKHRFGVQIRNLSHSPVTVQLFLRNLDPVETTIKPKTVIVPGQKVMVTVTVDCSHSPGERFGLLVLRLMAGRELEQVVKIPVYVNIADETILNSGDTTPLPLHSASDAVSALGAQRHVAFTSLTGVKTLLSRPWRDLNSIAASAPAGNSPWGKGTEKGDSVQPAEASRAAAQEERDARGRPRSALGGSPVGESDTSAIAGTYKRRDASTSPSSNSDVSDTSDGTEQAPLKSRRSIRELTTRQCLTVQREQYLQQLRNVLPAAVIQKQMTLALPSGCAKDAPYMFQKTQPRRESATQKKVTLASLQYETARTHDCKWRHKHHCSRGLKCVRSHSGDSRTTEKAPCALPSAKRSAAQPIRKSQPLRSLPSSRDHEANHRPPHLQQQQRKVPLPVPHKKKSSFLSPQSVDSPRSSSTESSGCERAIHGDRCEIPSVQSDFEVFRGSVQTKKRWYSATHAFDERNDSVLSTAPDSFRLDGKPQSVEGVSRLSAGRGCTSLRGKSVGCSGGRDETVQRSSCIQESPRSDGSRRFTLTPHNKSRQYQGATLLLHTLQGTDTLPASTSSSNAASARRVKKATAVRCSNISGESFSRTVSAAAEKRLEELRMQGSIYALTG